MIKIGITGNIGAGKTTFAKLFETEISDLKDLIN